MICFLSFLIKGTSSLEKEISSHPEHFLLSELKINNKMIESSCCGMAGSFGYDSKNYEVSKKMANLSLIPSIKSSNGNDFIVANGTSCRHQISDLSQKKGKHISELLFKIFETVN